METTQYWRPAQLLRKTIRKCTHTVHGKGCTRFVLTPARKFLPASNTVPFDFWLSAGNRTICKSWKTFWVFPGAPSAFRKITTIVTRSRHTDVNNWNVQMPRKVKCKCAWTKIAIQMLNFDCIFKEPNTLAVTVLQFTNCNATELSLSANNGRTSYSADWKHELQLLHEKTSHSCNNNIGTARWCYL